MSEREFYPILLFVFLGIAVFVFVAFFLFPLPMDDTPGLVQENIPGISTRSKGPCSFHFLNIWESNLDIGGSIIVR